ncbi:MAG: phosphodiesterase [Bauldia sp.]|uniref:phosphodiesterase n=1 Tax=Bauldia sp. TaxID=2575872 RepID=UPI001DA3E616|nr:phosphodiesterase [Bauldia sp.]MCB1496184.1 phosphodiesterase [Bauldia sp.]
MDNPPPETRDDLAVGEILAAVGDVVYDWSIGDDTLRWSPNALDAIGIASFALIATGRAFARLLEHGSPASRYSAVHDGRTDPGDGVCFQVEYPILPEGPGSTRRLWIEDVGRWYAGTDGRPARVHGVMRVITERHERERHLAYLSHHDELTGCFNRSHLLATLEAAAADAARGDRSIAFLIVSFDNLQAISEAYGHATAEQALAVIAHRIGRCLRETDAIGRFSGGKLGLVLADCKEADMAGAAARFHAAARDELIELDTGPLAVTVSIGGVSLPRHGRAADEAVASALEALHVARRTGSGRFAAYEPTPDRLDDRKLVRRHSRELLTALHEGRIRLVFQPVVDIATRSPLFYEALARVEESDGTVVAPAQFIALAEQLGLIRLIDDRIVGLALDMLERRSDIHLSINISASTIGDREWIARLSDRLRDRPGLARRLIIEITETVAIDNVEEAAEFIRTLHALGCRAAIDDFGAGFSSFRNLRLLDVDFFKIDGSFIENLATSHEDRTFVKALAELARSFGIPVVAEWVQDEGTVSLLAGWGIDCIQGALTGDVMDQPD